MHPSQTLHYHDWRKKRGAVQVLGINGCWALGMLDGMGNDWLITGWRDR